MANSDPVSRWDHEAPRAVSESTGDMLEAGQPLQPKQSSRKLCVDSWAPEKGSVASLWCAVELPGGSLLQTPNLKILSKQPLVGLLFFIFFIFYFWKGFT